MANQAVKLALKVPEQQISYFTTKAFDKALQEAFLAGGQIRKRADRARIVLGSLKDPDPFASLKVTNYGENRIKNCVKYDLGDGWRLVTRQTDKTCTFLFVGDHADADRWIQNHAGEDVGVRDRHLVRVPGVGTESIHREALIVHNSESLVDLLGDEYVDILLKDIPAMLLRKLSALDATCRPPELQMLLATVSDSSKREFLLQVFLLLLEGNVDGAKAHVDLRIGRIASVEDCDPHEILAVQDGEDIRRLQVGSLQYEEWLRAFELRSSWHDWFLFLHPEQESIVVADYSGTAQLSGVSGSGKTCVAVRRALRLAEAEGARVLLLTLNRSLAGLLRQLVDAACVDEKIRNRIEVNSFFELAQSMLKTYDPTNRLSYHDVTWKLHEHVDEIFREYYRGWANNHDADVLLSLHKSLNARGVAGEPYIRQEFDWIRSALTPDERERYQTIERKGRKFPISAERRSDVLQGLSGWESKMSAVGVIDYLGLTSELIKHISKVEPRYTSILVDEAQDFGTTELAIIRLLVPVGTNDIFLCGDVAQTVLPKSRSLVEAGLTNVVRDRIRRNYRNSREILAAAYRLLTENLHEELFESGDLEVLDPKFANFSGPAPIALAANSLEEEIAYARTYAASAAKNVCIAFAGYSSRDVHAFAKKCGMTALDGAYDPRTDRLVFSDLEQTKGYEFDALIVVNCSDGVLPARDAPNEEQFRDLCKLYVAMTRAKREMILSFSGSASEWLRTVSDTITTDYWNACETIDSNLLQGIPELLSEVELNTTQDPDLMSRTGRQFLYTSHAIGLSPEAQDKLDELVDGKGLVRAGSGRRIKWPTLRDLASDLHASHLQDGLFGSAVADELRHKFG